MNTGTQELPAEEGPSDEELEAIETQTMHGLDLENPLDDLFTEAMAAGNKKARRHTNPALKNSLDAAAKSLKEVFSLPENWHRTRGIALIHRDTDTLLGNFSEYLHNSVAGARKLVRETMPIAVTATEYVAGSWWLGADMKPRKREEWHTRKHAIIKVHLPGLGLFAPVVEVEALVAYGGIARVELSAATQFADETGHQLVDLPQGTDVMEAMSQECKIALRKEIKL